MFAKGLSLFLVIASLAACSPSSSPTSVASAPVPGPVVPVGEPEVHDLGPTTETVWNCGSGGGTVVKHPSMSVVTNYAVEWEVGGTTGVGLKIGEGVIPGGVDLSASLEGRYVTGFEQGIQKGTDWDLPAEPNTVVIYTLMWREVWQPGYVDVRLADQSVVRVNVRYRTGIQSEIVGKQRQTCGEEQQASTQVLPTESPLRITPTTVISAGSSTRPSGVTLPPGGKFTPTQEWAWVCTGDLALIRKDESATNLFDELEYTGLITVFAPNSEVSAFAPYGGYCEPFSPETKELIVSTKISTMLNSPIQCQGGCSSVNIKELDVNGNIVRDYWKP